MTKVGLIKFLVMLLAVQSAYGQKVKYKDIFGLLSTKQYAQAEPFLKRYIKDNDDNPNAFLFMGTIYQDKASRNDILKETKLAITNMDSAIYFYDLSLKIMDEKEIRKNKEYYESYNRRDLRTGEYGVKLADVQFDVQKKIEGLKERIGHLKMAKHYFILSDSLYKSCQSLFGSLQKKYSSEREFLLRGDEITLKKLTLLETRFDSAIHAFDNYHTVLQHLGKTGYNQVVKLQEIKNFPADGSSSADFLKDDLELWDYKKFGAVEKEKIQKEIIPTHETLVSFDVEINKYREKLNQDSVSVKKELAELKGKLPVSLLKKFDSDPLPLNIFALKMADMDYKSTLIEHKPLRDTADVHLQVMMATEEKKSISALDSMASKLESVDIDSESENYSYFVTNAYQNAVVLKSYVKALKEYASRESENVNAKLNEWSGRLKWLYVDNDSIPLTSDTVSSKFKPLAIHEEKYTAGLAYADSLKVSGYFYTIVPSRRPDVRVQFDVDNTNFRQSQLPSIKALSVDNNGQVYFVVVYSGKPVKEKYPATVAKIYRTDGLAWAANYQLTQLPTELSFKPETGELSIKLANQEMNVLDKNGKMKK